MKTISILLLTAAAFAQEAETAKEPEPPAITAEHYRVYRGDGTPATLEQAVAESRAATVTFLGESHDDPVAHHLELEILKRAHRPGLVLSLEMFERDVQYVLDEYLAGQITEDHLLKSGRAWNNYKSDYKPMVEFAKEQKMPVLAANPPRRYVNRVSRLGAADLMALSPEAKRYLPPLPYANASPEYKEKFIKEMESHRQDDAASSEPGDYTKGLEAQSLWDAGMAFSIAEHLLRSPGANVMHVNGSFHSAQHLGILDHLARYSPRTSTLVITMLSGKSFPSFDPDTMRGQGDFVIVTDPSLPRSYVSGER